MALQRKPTVQALLRRVDRLQAAAAHLDAGKASELADRLLEAVVAVQHAEPTPTGPPRATNAADIQQLPKPWRASEMLIVSEKCLQLIRDQLRLQLAEEQAQ